MVLFDLVRKWRVSWHQSEQARHPFGSKVRSQADEANGLNPLGPWLEPGLPFGLALAPGLMPLVGLGLVFSSQDLGSPWVRCRGLGWD